MSFWSLQCSVITIDALSGYKLRKHIGKALQARSSAIKTALEHYNVAARPFLPCAVRLLWRRWWNTPSCRISSYFKTPARTFHSAPGPAQQHALRWTHISRCVVHKKKSYDSTLRYTALSHISKTKISISVPVKSNCAPHTLLLPIRSEYFEMCVDGSTVPTQSA